MKLTYQKLEKLYLEYNKFCYIHPDPLEFVYKYNDDNDREIVGLLASSLAYGNVKQILRSVDKALSKMGNSPGEYIRNNDRNYFMKSLNGFKHRFTTCEDIVNFLLGIKNALENHGSLKDCFSGCLKLSGNNFLNAVSLFTEQLNIHCKNNKSYLLPSPENGSACKRLMLYLRWMIRKDEVDPGCWCDSIEKSDLIIPLDTHMFNISKEYGLTSRKTADLKTAVEITKSFADICPDDPVKYDFVLTRFGIRDELDYRDLSERVKL